MSEIRIEITSKFAGAGKSTVLNIIKKALESEGYAIYYPTKSENNAETISVVKGE